MKVLLEDYQEPLKPVYIGLQRKTKTPQYLFLQQCKPNINSSVLPNLAFLTDIRIDQIIIGNDEIISLIRSF